MSTAATAVPIDERVAWRALIVILGATVMVALDTTIVNVALTQIGKALGGGRRVEWVVTAYLLAVCVSQPASGWLANTFGARRILRISLVAFTAASLACSAAPNLGFLVAARVVQGLGGGALMPIGMAMVLGLFRRERHGRAISVWGLSATLAPAIGPTIGGWLVTSVNWHWLFLINGPIGVATYLAGLRLLPDVGVRDRRPFDAIGLLLGGLGLSLTVMGLSEGNSWGWRTPSTLLALVVGLAALGGFIWHELHVQDPLIELRMFNGRSFRLAMGALFFVFIAHFGRLVFIPLQLEGLRGVSALKVGLLFLPAGIITGLSITIGGRLVDNIGPRRPIMIGALSMIAAAIGFATLTLTTPLWLIEIYMCVNSFGIGILTAPALVAGISDLPPHLTSQGTAVRSLLSQISGALAVAILGAIVAARSGTSTNPRHLQSAYDMAFAAAAIGVLFAVVLALRLPKHEKVRRTAEHAALLD
jgi:EmrB/QacA subfamily drug resistance transporter